MARTTRLTPDIVRTIVRKKATGATHRAAAAAAAVPERTLRSWLKRGEAGEEPYASFVLAFRHAEAQKTLATVNAARAEVPEHILQMAVA